VDKPLATLWRNHTGTDKPNIVMKVCIYIVDIIHMQSMSIYTFV
jgi:hypothetical protein